MADITNLDDVRVQREAIEVRAGDLPRLVVLAEAALLKADAGIYQRGGQLVRIVELEDIENDTASGVSRAAGSVLIKPLTKDYLTFALARAARWTVFDRRLRDVKAINPPTLIANTLLAIAGEWRFPVLAGLVAAPTLRANGTLLASPGYDSESGIFAVFEPAAFPPINPTPSRDEALTALCLLDDLFSECAFTGGDRSAHASVAIAATVTACVRHALPIAPAFGIGAHKASSGKTTLARTVSQICSGAAPPVMALSQDETELRKALLAILIAGDLCVLVDNVTRPVDSASLCAILTSPLYSDRLLGVNSRVSLSTAVTWLVTGNHLEFVGDLTTRAVLATLDPQTEHPEARQFKRDIAAYVTENRGKLLAAALTIPLAYLAAGEPAVAGLHSRFAEWDRLVRRPMLWLGAADPLETQAQLAAADPVREGLVTLLHAWRDAFAQQTATVALLIKAATAPGQSAQPQLLEALGEIAGERNGTINAKKLGRYLVRNLRRIEDGMRLEDMGKDVLTHRRQFRLTVFPVL